MRMTLDGRWARARTVADLAGLTADWLEGRLPGGHPGGYDRPDEETADLVPDLVRLNRAGYATDCSQPGESGPGYDGAHWEQRSAVDGWVEPGEQLDRIVSAASAAGLLVIQQSHSTGRLRRGPSPLRGVPVTRRAGRDRTWFARRLTDGDLRRSLRGLHREAYRALDRAVYLTVVDPAWGRADRLWHVLDKAVR
ncbi:hypothetical protein RM844_30220 [Streptomyces sp. DSM 44915]|uniref:DUF6919 domain-containing protein n=1 Tax=Streptomyces chisholmiae TaxID=3075540 RepID=A0ABU2K034_9ACTN|nr:hypothetical protein [Streptomyces sp. DSM 44915]MDT0270557.1 hypothetical protein [Streptomyces sp. DSM 44915]